MRVRWTPRARDGFRRQTRYIARDSPTAARQVAARVRAAVNGLATHPLKGRPGQVVDTRELVIPRTPFTVAYRVSEQFVEIVGVIHQAQQWPESFD
jgi:toxin ParE1/3/4